MMRSDWKWDFKTLALCMLEDGASPEELKSVVDDAVAELEQARKDAGR
jgi:hypothetical protein